MLSQAQAGSELRKKSGGTLVSNVAVVGLGRASAARHTLVLLCSCDEALDRHSLRSCVTAVEGGGVVQASSARRSWF